MTRIVKKEDLPVTPRGLPAPLPADEHILWQGKPAWRTLARRAMHLRGMSLYFGALALWRGIDVSLSGGSVLDAIASASFLLMVGAGVMGFLTLYAWAAARATYYTLTNKRVIMSFGVALPMSMNIPYGLVESAALKLWPNGKGDIPFAVKAKRRLSYILLWPHVRPWRMTKVEPMFRSIPDAERVAAIFAEQLRLAQATEAAIVEPTPAREETPAPQAARPLAPAHAQVHAHAHA